MSNPREAAIAVEFIVESGHVGGAETQLLTLCDRLVQAGHRPTVLFLQGVGPIVDALRDAGVPVAAVTTPERRRPAWSRWPVFGRLDSARQYARYGRRPAPATGIVHAMLDGSIAASQALRPAIPDRQAFVAGILGGRKGRQGALDVGGAIRARRFATSLRAADAVICNAAHLRDEVVRDLGVPASRVVVIPNGVDLPTRPARPDHAPPRGVVVANFHPYKGYDDLVDAVGLLGQPPVLRLCGTGSERNRVLQRAHGMGLGGVLVGVEPPADVAAELRSAQFAVHPSRTEGLSNAILEEMAAGLPVIACDVGGNPALVEHGVNGLLVPAGDPPALARAIEALAGDPGTRARMGAASRAKASALSWDRCVAAHVEAYRAVLLARSAGTR